MTHTEYIKKLEEIETKRHEQMSHVRDQKHFDEIVNRSRQAIRKLNREYIDSAWNGLNK